MSTILDIIESTARKHPNDGLRVDDIQAHGNAFFAEVVRRGDENARVKKGDVLSSLKSVKCEKCGEEATRTRVQLRSGDEGENTVIFCQKCGIRKVIA